MQMLSPGPRRRATVIRVGSFWQLWSVLYQVGHGNYVFVAFVMCQYNCHKFIVVLKFLFFSLDHSAKDGNWCQRADFFLEETFTWVENKCHDLISSDWLWSFFHQWVHNRNIVANGRSPGPWAVSVRISTLRNELGLAWWFQTWKRRPFEDLEIIVPFFCLGLSVHTGECPPSRR